VIERLAVIGIGSGFEEREGESGIIVEAGSAVEAGEWPGFEVPSGVGVRSKAQQEAAGFDYVSSARGGGVGEAGETNIEQRRPLLGSAGRRESGICGKGLGDLSSVPED
jgi:hypothetical protein